MEKRIIQKEIDYDFDWQGLTKLSIMEIDLDVLKKLGATHLIIDARGENDLYTQAINEREETDEEFEDRKLELESREYFRLERKKKEFYRLKEELESLKIELNL